MEKRVYLDYAASTPVDPAAFDAMKPYFSEKFGNPGSVHSFGQEAIAALDHSRETIAKTIGAEFREVVFTASATEANNLAINGAVVGAYINGLKEKARVIISSIEHESVLEAARAVEKMGGAEVIIIPVDKEGRVNAVEIKKSLNEKTVLVSVMHANNEIGTVQPIYEIAARIAEFKKEHGGAKYPLFHTDAAQAFQFLACDVKELGVDLMTLSSHKIYGPKGAGALYIKSGVKLNASLAGGGQEFGFRSGTENVPAAAGFAKAAEITVPLREKESKRIGALREKLWKGIKEIFSDAEVNGISGNGENLPNILNVYIPGREAQDVLTKLDLNGIAASSGSACRSRAIESSYVIETLGYSKERAKSSIRFSLGRPTTEADIEQTLKILKLF